MTYICFINDNICPLILKRHMYTFHISFICPIIFNAHVHVMYYKQPCRLQPTTSYHTVLGFPILARVTAHNFSKSDFIHVTFCVCSFRVDLLVQNDHLRDPLPDWNSQGTGSPCHYIFYLVEDGPLCRHRIRAKRVTSDNLFQFNFKKIRWIFFLSLSLVMVSYRGSPG